MADVLKRRRTMKLAVLVADPANARTHDDANIASIRDSLEQHGQVRDLLIQQGTGFVIAGNGTMAAMVESGWTEASCTVLKCSDREARELSIRLNRTAELASWDEKVLAGHLADLVEQYSVDRVEGLGFDKANLRDLVLRFAPERSKLVQFETNPDGAPPEFPSFGSDIDTKHECPKCHYKWSGDSSPKGNADSPNTEQT